MVYMKIFSALHTFSYLSIYNNLILFGLNFQYVCYPRTADAWRYIKCLISYYLFLLYYPPEVLKLFFFLK